MKKDPERKRAQKKNITSTRLDDEAVAQLTRILSDNPLYTRAHVLRGAIEALYRLPKDQREAIIRAAAEH
ncbi:hypothetical protein [Siccibacter turicensis]|uniref:hypothetical protein n=1 Tax=Siccibacter turicensis TaxID=357233 RepID=UPI003F54F3DF